MDIPMPKLTKRVIDALAPPPAKGEAFTWDTELKGFGVRLMGSGVGSYILKYRNQEGRQRKLAIGRIGALTPDEARALARQRLAEIAKGGDPSENRRAIRASITMSELCDLYLTDAATRIKPSTLTMDRSRIACHVKPLIGSRPVIGLTTSDLERMQADIAAGKSARGKSGKRGGATRGGPGVASRTAGMVGTILEFGRRRKVITVNPARDVIRLPEGKQERYLSREEIGRLGATMAEMERETGHHVGLVAIRFLLTTGQRRMESLALPLTWVDAEANCVRFVSTKGVKGLKGGTRIEVRPIGDSALQLLETVQRPAGSRWAFPGYSEEKHYVGLPKFLGTVCARAGLKDVTIHVARHSFVALAKELGYSEFVIAGLIGHRLGGVTARYGQVPDKALVAAANDVSSVMLDALCGRSSTSLGNSRHKA
jgi:site-specific recombinase XerD